MTDTPSSRHHRLDYLELAVTDLQAAREFYGAAFGWAFTEYGPTYMGFADQPGGEEVGGMTLADEVRGGGPFALLFSTDLDASAQAVRDAGGVISTEPYAFPGGRRLHFTDPSGNELGIWSE